MSDVQPKRILHLISSERWTGVAEPAVGLARLQQKRGCAVWIGMIRGRSLEEKVAAVPLPIAEAIRLERRFNPLVLLQDVERLQHFISHNGIEAVHCHLLHDHWLAAWAIGRLRDQKPLLVRTVHRYEPMRRDLFHRKLFERTDLIITVSREQETLIRAAYPACGERLRVIYGGVDPERFRPDLPGAASVRADMGEKPDAPVAAIVAHLGYNRGHRWLMKAAPKVIAEVPNCSIWIVGQGELRKELTQQVHNPVFRDRIVMAGYRTTDLPETYAAVDVALLLGLGSEGSARAALEAMASGKPVIAVKKGALNDTITDGVNGLLVDEGNAEQLAAAMIRLLGNREEARRMGAGARETIVERFTEERREQFTMEAYTAANRARL